MPNTLDLHIHTTASDGTDSPARLLENLKNAGITTFSVTDHDTVDGTLEMENLVTGDLRFIRGIEFSCITPAGKCHILGYNYNPEDSVFQAALHEGSALRLDNLNARIRYLHDTLGVQLTAEEETWLYSLKSPGKPHLGKILVNRGIAENINKAIQVYINPHKLSRERIDGSTAVEAILHAGGIPVWAHPLGGEGEKRLTAEEFSAQLDYLMGLGIQGLECHYSRYETTDREFLTAQANAHNLLISGGSDYHGSNKTDLPLGRLSADDAEVVAAQLTILDVLS